MIELFDSTEGRRLIYNTEAIIVIAGKTNFFFFFFFFQAKNITNIGALINELFFA